MSTVNPEMFEKLRDAALAVSRRLGKFIGYLEDYPSNSRVRRSRKSQVQKDL